MTGFYWLASYPKSGNTWLRLALHALAEPDQPLTKLNDARFAPNASRRNDLEDALDTETSDLGPTELRSLRPVAYRALAAEARRPLFRKVHDAWTEIAPGVPLFPPDITLGTLLIVRDPRDVAISWAHFASIPIDDAIEILCDPTTTLGRRAGRAPLMLPQTILCWSGHARSWLEAPGRPACLIRYEDMLADPGAVLRRVAAYAGIQHGEHDIAHAVAATGFDRLRTLEAEHGFDGGQTRGSPFFRSGRAGGWRATLTRSQAARIEGAHAETMRHLGYS